MAESVYARLARWLLPRELAREYVGDAIEMFRDRARAPGTRAGVLRVLARAVADLLVQSVAMRLERAVVPRAAVDGGTTRRGASSALRMDARHALRQWRRAPGFALAVLLTLGLGIGVSTAMFSVLNGVALRPLPFAQPDGLVMVWERNLERGWPRFTVSPANYFDWSTRATRFDGMAAYASGTATLLEGGEPTRLQTVSALWNIFAVVGVGPVIGRGFALEENEVGRDGVVILSHRLWSTRFGADSTMLDRSLTVDGQERRVIGVLPPDFGLSPDADAWFPLVFPFDIGEARGAKYLSVVARLADGATAAVAQSQMDDVTAALQREYEDVQAGWTAVVVPMREQMLGTIERTLRFLFAAVGLVMLIACSNVVNLLLARGTSRGDEFGLRKAMGAGPGRLARQLVVETLLLTSAGAVAGLGIAWGVTRVLVAMNPGRLPRAANIGVDTTVLLFCIALSLAVGLAIGLVPALQAARANVALRIEGGRAGIAGRRSRRLRSGLLIGEIAMAVMLFVGWGLVAQRLYALLAVHPGFQAGGLVTARLSPTAARYPTPAARAAFYEAVLERLRGQPQIERVGLTNRLPLTGLLSFGVTADRPPVPPSSEWASGELRAVNADYFEAMGVAIVRGRAFTPLDRADAPAVAIVNETLARVLFPNLDPVGERILVSSSDAACPCEVVGVAADVRETRLDQPAGPVYYLPESQSVWTARSLVIRSSAPMATVVSNVREAVAAVDPEIALFDVQPLERVVAERLATPRFNALLLGLFAVLALFLAAVGIYGVTSYVVNQRRREMGVRSALGARAGGLIWLIERETMVIAAAGIALGLLGALTTMRFATAAVFGIDALDPAVVVGAALFLALVSAFAALLPAWRAGRIDPVEALRME